LPETQRKIKCARAEDPGRTPEADAAVRFWKAGFRPVPLLPLSPATAGTDANAHDQAGPRPITGAYLKVYDTASELRAVYRAHPGAGVGLALGCDDDNRGSLMDIGVFAHQPAIRSLFGHDGPPPTASWRTDSQHHLFWLSPANKAEFRAAGVPVRGMLTMPGAQIRFSGVVAVPVVWDDPAVEIAQAPVPFLNFAKVYFAGRVAQSASTQTAMIAGQEQVVPCRTGLDGHDPLTKAEIQLDKLGLKPVRTSNGLTAICPIHRGGHPNFDLALKDGRLLWRCHACGSDHEAVDYLTALGLRWKDAFAGDEDGTERPKLGAYLAYGSSVEERASDEHVEHYTTMHELARETMAEDPSWLDALAEDLGLPPAAITPLGPGVMHDLVVLDVDGQWVRGVVAPVFPCFDGEERIIGIQTRCLDERADPEYVKRWIKGSKSGLFIPAGWRDMSGEINLVEGASDVAAMLAMGWCAIGRPNNAGGAAHLARLLEGDEREVIAWGENDWKADGSWPGHPERFAQDLARRLGRSVKTKRPPAGFKDARAFASEWLKKYGESK
jgi:Bifunctional DNA primase/polymerase, N-terminal